MTDPITRLNRALEGRYRIEGTLGEGGMAVVYLADDLRHERKVALKVLKPELAAVVGAERFLSEIKTTASLQHPHILPLYDSGEADSFLFYVMPYVEGESLQDRLERERHLPVDAAVRIAGKVLAALEHAHQAGVVHRDVKPANILLSGGEPLVADFGIALAVSQAGDGRITETGLTLGTPHYMSPEQATGDRAVDPRSDLWAVACVLYEMLAGQPPFTGATAQAVLAKLLTEDAPDLREQRSSVPEHVAAAVDTGLERLPADRFQTAREFAEALANPGHGVRPGTRRAAAAPPPPDPLRRAAGVLGWAVAVVLAAVWLLGRGAGEPAVSPDPLRFTLPLDQAAGVDRNSSTALSPDEDVMAFDVRGADRTGLFLHRFATGITEAIPDTDLGRFPFFSPDGRQVGFFTEAALHAVDLATGRVELLVQDPALGIFDQRGIWLDDGHILVDHSETDDLWMVPPGTSRVVRLAAADDNQEVTGFQITSRSARLPGGHALVTGFSRTDEAVPVLVTPATGEVRRLSGDGMEGAVMGAWGDTVVVGRPQIQAAAFMEVDPARGRGRIVGERRLDPIFTTGFGRWFDLRPRLMTGLVNNAAGSQTVHWLDASGTRTPVGLPTADWEYPRVSPTGDRLLVTESSSTGAYEVQVILDLRTGATTPLPEGGEHTWSHDGRYVYFQGSEDDGGFTIVRHRADGTGQTEVVASGLSQPPWVTSASPDGGSVLFYGEAIQEVDPTTGEVRILIDDDGIERNGMFSPDGRFIAYSATGAGREVVYVKPYPKLDRRWTISPGEGRLPMWSRDGRTLFYIDGNRVYTVAMETSADGELQPAAPELFFQGDFYLHPSGDQSYDVAPDGSLVMIQGNREMRVEVIVDWRGFGDVSDAGSGAGG